MPCRTLNLESFVQRCPFRHKSFFKENRSLVISFCKIFKISVCRKEILSKWLNIQSFGNNMLILSQPYIHMLLLTGCCYQPGVVTNRLLSPTECYYQQGVVTNQVLLPKECWYKQVLLPNGCYYQMCFVNKLGIVKPGFKTNWPSLCDVVLAQYSRSCGIFFFFWLGVTYTISISAHFFINFSIFFYKVKYL